jgi:hypothetical protein
MLGSVISPRTTFESKDIRMSALRSGSTDKFQPHTSREQI